MIRLLSAAVAMLALAAAPARAEYPDRPIKVITTSSAGGISDIFMRVLGEELHKSLGQPFIIENKPGAAGNIAAHACQDAKPDGYTICIINADPMIYNQYIFKTMPFDPEKGLTPIVNLFHLIQILVVNADLKVKSVDELVALSKAKPKTLAYLTASLPLVVYMERLNKEKGADWVRVPFKGGGEATNAILSGSTPIGLIGLGNVIGHLKAGKMTALVLVNNIRTPLLPDVPTFDDLGYKGPPSRTWYGLFAPAGTPKEIVDKLYAEVAKVMGDKDFVDKFIISRGQVPALNTPQEFAAEIAAERATAEAVVKESGMGAKP
ncbi:MAG TPA: tripartite tricarboxylate transporter substrate binding protein [Pseudolabrys sp.]|nr:tripartite tricarboxylate transporter substrate binding protein [Pseudolabrys sp.]